MPRRHIECQCGGRLPDPVPPLCPHCGAPIVAVRRRSRWPLGSLLMILGMFAALALFTWWMAAARFAR
jgi:hypothetical protein